MGAGLLDPEFLIGASLSDDRFKIVARLGAGSMAVVYRAFDYRLETDVVVKVPKKEKLQDTRLRERFRRESRLLVQLQHPHVVGILDVGEYQNLPFVVMQYLSGGCLLDRLQGNNKQPSPMEAKSVPGWLMEVAKALDFAHQRNVVHRDVKPANILFDESGNAYLSDFGLTKMLQGQPDQNNADETAAGFVVGTPNFVAPEIVLGAEYDGRADQYSLAITVYNAVTGTPPMLGKTASATMVNQTRLILPLLSDVRKDVPVATAVAVAKALSKAPEERFSSCVEFAAAAISGLATVATTVGLASHFPNQPTGSGRNSTVKAAADVTGCDKPRVPAFSTSVPVSSIPVVPVSVATVARESGVSLEKETGVIDCPKCGKELRLRQEHAGRTGKCIDCGVRLKIAEDLSRLTVISKSQRKAHSGSADSSSGQRADDLIIGEKVFGLKLGRPAIFGIGIAMILALVIGVVALVVQILKTNQGPDPTEQYRTLE